MTALGARQGTDAWIHARMAGIGSSDAPVVAGESPYRSALELWAEKSGRVPRQEPDADQARLFRIGHLMEPVLLTLYTEATGRKTRREPRMLQHSTLPWMLASLDARVVGEHRIVECKWSNARRWTSGDEPVPGDVLIQVQHAMAVARADVADVVALIGPSLRIVEVPRDDAFIADLLEIEADFWRHVQEGVPPAADGSESTRRALARMHPRDDGTLLPATADLVGLVDELRAAKAAAKDAEDAEKSISNALRALLGDASGIDGLVTYRRNADATRTNWPAVADAYRHQLESDARDRWEGDLLAQSLAGLDEIQARHTTTVDGPRVLRLSKEKTA